MNAWGDRVWGVYTPRLRLRLPRPADAIALSRLMTPGISARLASWPAFLSSGDARLRIEQSLAAFSASELLPMLITCRRDETVLGWISIALGAGTPTAGIMTYWLGDAHQGNGLMREAAPAARDAAFTWLNLAEIRAAVQPDNAASRSVLRGVGMRLLGTGSIWCGPRGREEGCEWWGVSAPARLPSLNGLGDCASPTMPHLAAGLAD
jgi:RimJ/RimL family protein N-acetyltransferase